MTATLVEAAKPRNPVEITDPSLTLLIVVCLLQTGGMSRSVPIGRRQDTSLQPSDGLQVNEPVDLALLYARTLRTPLDNSMSQNISEDHEKQ